MFILNKKNSFIIAFFLQENSLQSAKVKNKKDYTVFDSITLDEHSELKIKA